MSDREHVTRSAETGQFVSDDEAAKHPATTVRESVADEVNAPLPELVGYPAAASRTEQLYRGAILLKRAGAGQWPVCGRH